MIINLTEDEYSLLILILARYKDISKDITDLITKLVVAHYEHP